MQLNKGIAVLLALYSNFGSSLALSVMLGGKPAERLHALSANVSVGALTARRAVATAADVAKLHQKLGVVASSMEGLLSPEKGSLAKAKVAPALRVFLKELHQALNATENPKDIPAAMAKLRKAQAGVAELTRSLSQQQEALMREDATEQTNLLLGVLMTRRAEPLEKQLEVLASKDFGGLPVSKALLAKHDVSKPLFQLVAEFVDAHGGGGAAATKSAEAKAQKLAKTISYFEQRAQALTAEEQSMQKMHERREAELDKLISGASSDAARKEAHKLTLMKRHSSREYKKKFLLHQQQTKMFKDVVSALKRGDISALKTAQDALQAHMDAMQKQRGNFLHLLQLGHRLASKDCPFCVAQCIGKCHDSGSPYALCLSQCADAGH